MQNNLEKIIHLAEIEPSHKLKDKILKRIAHAQQQKILRKIFALRFGMALSGIGFIYALNFAGKEFFSSDFWSISMLGFSDAPTLLSHWQEFGLSLLETLPAMAIAEVLVPLLLLMVMLKIYARLDVPSSFKLKSA